jgi:N-acetyl-anhydromuramyl-L-alanine amidase AmpD
MLRSAVAWAAATGALAAAAGAAPKPRIVEDPISYGGERREQMAGYSQRHYGEREWRLRDPDAVVLHYTAGGTYSSAWSAFDSNAPNRGELPGVCAHYVVKKSGRIAELVPPRIRCRHAVGLNHRSIGVEMVQEAGPGSAWADRQILDREPQIRAALRLVDWLQGRFEIATGDVIGHSMANDSPYFKDLEGWRNDHTDWLQKDVRVFRKRLRRL